MQTDPRGPGHARVKVQGMEMKQIGEAFEQFHVYTVEGDGVTRRSQRGLPEHLPGEALVTRSAEGGEVTVAAPGLGEVRHGIPQKVPRGLCLWWRGAVIQSGEATPEQTVFVTTHTPDGAVNQTWCAGDHRLLGMCAEDLYPDEVLAQFPDAALGDLFSLRDLTLLLTPAGLRPVSGVLFTPVA